MASYKHPCKYCGKLIERDSNFCPFCAQEARWGLLDDHCAGILFRMGQKFGGIASFRCGQYVIIAGNCGTAQSITNKKCIKCGELLR